MKGNIYLFQILLTICIVLVVNAEEYNINNFRKDIPEDLAQTIKELKAIDPNVAVDYCEKKMEDKAKFCTEYVYVYVPDMIYLSDNPDDQDKEDDNSKDKNNTSEDEKIKITEENIKNILIKGNERFPRFKKLDKRELDILTKKLLKKRT